MSAPSSSNTVAEAAPRSPQPAAFSGLLVISPHLDSGVFGCGRWLSAQPRSVVVTVFAALPEDGLLTDWDTRCGFSSSREAVGTRHREDDAALAVLAAVPLRLGFFDSQYGQSTSVEHIASALADVLTLYKPEKVAVPLGLHDADHVLASDAALLAMQTWPGVAWYAYADALYRQQPGLMEQRLGFLRSHGVNALPAPPGTLTGASSQTEVHHAAHKNIAVAKYVSQTAALETLGYDDVHAPEQYWRLFWRGPERPRDAVKR